MIQKLSPLAMPEVEDRGRCNAEQAGKRCREASPVVRSDVHISPKKPRGLVDPFAFRTFQVPLQEIADGVSGDVFGRTSETGAATPEPAALTPYVNLECPHTLHALSVSPFITPNHVAADADKQYQCEALFSAKPAAAQSCSPAELCAAHVNSVFMNSSVNAEDPEGANARPFADNKSEEDFTARQELTGSDVPSNSMGQSSCRSLGEAKVVLSLAQQPASPSNGMAEDADTVQGLTYLARLGDTKTSIVYLARSAMQETFAVKIFKQPFVSRTMRANQLNEVAVLGCLAPENQHPNIVKHYRAWQENQRLHIQMEACEGGSLDALLRKDLLYEGPHPSEDVLWLVLRDASAGLASVHSHGVIHLDIKPDNIYLHINGSFKVGDFGIAIVASERGAWTEGDGRYLAPELLSAMQPTSAADIFSLGCTIMQIACGQLLNPEQLTVTRQAEALKAYSPQLQAVVRRMLSGPPDLRPSAEEIVQTIDCEHGIQDRLLALRPGLQKIAESVRAARGQVLHCSPSYSLSQSMDVNVCHNTFNNVSRSNSEIMQTRASWHSSSKPTSPEGLPGNPWGELFPSKPAKEPTAAPRATKQRPAPLCVSTELGTPPAILPRVRTRGRNGRGGPDGVQMSERSFGSAVGGALSFSSMHLGQGSGVFDGFASMAPSPAAGSQLTADIPLDPASAEASRDGAKSAFSGERSVRSAHSMSLPPRPMSCRSGNSRARNETRTSGLRQGMSLSLTDGANMVRTGSITPREDCSSEGHGGGWAVTPRLYPPGEPLSPLGNCNAPMRRVSERDHRRSPDLDPTQPEQCETPTQLERYFQSQNGLSDELPSDGWSPRSHASRKENSVVPILHAPKRSKLRNAMASLASKAITAGSILHHARKGKSAVATHNERSASDDIDLGSARCAQAGGKIASSTPAAAVTRKPKGALVATRPMHFTGQRTSERRSNGGGGSNGGGSSGRASGRMRSRGARFASAAIGHSDGPDAGAPGLDARAADPVHVEHFAKSLLSGPGGGVSGQSTSRMVPKSDVAAQRNMDAFVRTVGGQSGPARGPVRTRVVMTR